MIKALLVVAHPDDEVIFFWWALQNPDLQLSILCCSSDENNPDRKKWAHRKNGLIALCEDLKVPVKILPWGSGFYKLDGRTGKAAEFEKSVIDEVDKSEWEIVISHNPWGEYGHLDHIRVHNILAQRFPGQLVMCDAMMETEWTLPDERRKRSCAATEDVGNIITHYSKCAEFYKGIRAWTWNKPPIESCGIAWIRK
jgi:LmbE family N-acetylglucosaminyl deacetylase